MAALDRCLIDLATPGFLRGQILPEEGMVDVPPAVEFDRLLHGDELGDVVGFRRFLLRLECGIQAIDVGLMVLFVVQLHDLLGDVGLEGLHLLVCCHFSGSVETYIVGVGEGWERVLL